jgi:phosphocarrier protein HPr
MLKMPTKPKIAKGMFVVRNDRGLHTRPSTELVKCATSFRAEVRLSYQKNAANAKSLLGILMLAAAKGARIGIEATGEDAEEVVDSIIQLARNNFNIKY